MVTSALFSGCEPTVSLSEEEIVSTMLDSSRPEGFPMGDEEGTGTTVNLGDTFRLAGWAGFWVQMLLGVLPILVGLWMVSARPNSFARSIDWAGTLASASGIILVFTMLWSIRYVALGRRMRRTQSGLPRQKLRRVVEIGLGASALGIVLSAIVLLVETTQIVLAFLQAPQGGVPVVQTSPDSRYWISAVDAISLLGATLTIAAEIIALVLSLYLLFRISTAVPAKLVSGDG